MCSAHRDSDAIFSLHNLQEIELSGSYLLSGQSSKTTYLTKFDFIFCSEDIRLSFQQKLATTKNN